MCRGIFSCLFKSSDKPQNRTSGSGYSIFFGGSTAGKNVNERSSMQITTEYSSVRILAVSESGDVLPYYQEPLLLETQGPIALIGPAAIALQGGMGGTYVKTVGAEGTAVLRIRGSDTPPVELHFEIRRG